MSSLYETCLIFSQFLYLVMAAKEGQDSVDAQLGRRYQFELFENSKGCAEIYKQEAKVVDKLFYFKAKLLEIQAKINKFKFTNVTSTNLIDLKILLGSGQNFQNSQNKNLNHMTHGFPQTVDVIGSIKGMFILHYSYGMNMSKAVLEGDLAYTNHLGQFRKHQSFEKLMLIDVEQLALYAMEMGYYANAIELSREMSHILANTQLKHEEEMAIPQRFEHLKSSLMKLNNGYLEKGKSILANKSYMLPYMVDKKLRKKKNQPVYVTNGKVFDYHTDANDKIKEEWMFIQVCKNGKWYPKSYKGNLNLKCGLLHHSNPYLKLGPFKEDNISKRPYIVVFRDILSEKDIGNLIEKSTPILSRSRRFDVTGGAESAYDINSGMFRRVIHKTVQAWIEDVDWPLISEGYVGSSHNGIINPHLWKLNKRISLATQMLTHTQTSGTMMQVTNYGLAGLCEQHIDPHGIMETNDDYYQYANPELYIHGDIVATFMAWLSHTEEGGGTAFLSPGTEGLILPDRGSAVFWYDLKSDGYRDTLASHAGCPVLKGSKWILNKWLHLYDNHKLFPCNVVRNKYYDPPEKKHYL